MLKAKWETTKCPICGLTYQYPKDGYKPPTCNNFDCLHKYLHPNIRKGSLNVSIQTPR